jgi:hypothetical protein
MAVLWPLGSVQVATAMGWRKGGASGWYAPTVPIMTKSVIIDQPYLLLPPTYNFSKLVFLMILCYAVHIDMPYPLICTLC